jgi:hypothetical protein
MRIVVDCHSFVKLEGIYRAGLAVSLRLKE